jgi:hypothetical protein
MDKIVLSRKCGSDTSAYYTLPNIGNKFEKTSIGVRLAVLKHDLAANKMTHSSLPGVRGEEGWF